MAFSNFLTLAGSTLTGGIGTPVLAMDSVCIEVMVIVEEGGMPSKGVSRHAGAACGPLPDLESFFSSHVGEHHAACRLTCDQHARMLVTCQRWCKSETCQRRCPAS